MSHTKVLTADNNNNNSYNKNNNVNRGIEKACASAFTGNWTFSPSHVWGLGLRFGKCWKLLAGVSNPTSTRIRITTEVSVPRVDVVVNLRLLAKMYKQDGCKRCCNGVLVWKAYSRIPTKND